MFHPHRCHKAKKKNFRQAPPLGFELNLAALCGWSPKRAGCSLPFPKCRVANRLPAFPFSYLSFPSLRRIARSDACRSARSRPSWPRSPTASFSGGKKKKKEFRLGGLAFLGLTEARSVGLYRARIMYYYYILHVHAHSRCPDLRWKALFFLPTCLASFRAMPILARSLNVDSSRSLATVVLVHVEPPKFAGRKPHWRVVPSSSLTKFAA